MSTSPATPRRSLPTLHVTIDSTRLSDLFFNHENPNYEAEAVKEASVADQRLALRKDAEEFIQLLSGTKDDRIAALLVEDFFERL